MLDEKNSLYRNLNKQLVSMEEVSDREDAEELKRIIEDHVRETGSGKGKKILSDFDGYLPHFKKIIPIDYKIMLHYIGKEMETGADAELARIEAFRKFVNEGQR